MKNFSYFIFALVFLAGCSQLHEEPSQKQSSAKSASTYSVPHPSNWLSQHVEFYAKNGKQLQGTQQDCVRCHTGQQLSGSPRNVSCAGQCHTQTPGNGDARQPPLNEEGKACIACHADAVKKLKPHYPAAAGLCSTCHQVSADHLSGTNRKGVTTNGTNENCYSCHSQKDKLEHVHMALQMGDSSCLNCHNPHGSDHKYFVKQKLDTLCITCHETIPDEYKSIHGIIKSDKSEKSCTNCHDPHSSKNEKLLLTPKKELCLTCHDKEIKTTFSNGAIRVIPDIKEKLTTAPSPHPGALMNKENCTACHSPHVSENPFLLNQKYPDPPYAKYDPGTDKKPGTYALCFSCHDSAMLDKKIDASATNFRNDVKEDNGKINRENLHWFHVVNAAGDNDKEKGRSCYVCHDPHGSHQEHAVKTSWKLKNGTDVKVEYSTTPTGGQCTKTCHDLRTYSREE